MGESRASDIANMKNSKRLLLTGRICLVVSTLGMFIASYLFYTPYYYPFSSHIEPQIGQALLYGGILLSITVFTWIWPITGGIIAVLYSLIRLIQGFSPEPLTMIPVPVYVLLYGLFLAGGMTYLILGLIQEKPHTSHPPIKRTRWVVRFITIASIIVFVIIYTLVHPWGWVLCAIPALIVFGIAWFWPAPGGLLMLLFSIPAFYNLYESNYDFQLKLPTYILCLIFIASGVWHLIIAWWERRLRSG